MLLFLQMQKSVGGELAAGSAAVALAIQVLPDVLLAVVVGQLLKGGDVLGSKEADFGHVCVSVRAEYWLHIEVGVAAVIDVARHPTDLPAVHKVLVVLLPVQASFPMIRTCFLILLVTSRTQCERRLAHVNSMRALQRCSLGLEYWHFE